MLTRLLWVGLVAGILAGLATSAVQHFTTTPLIIAAEAYEGGSDEASAGTIQRVNASLFGLFGGELILAHGTETHADGSEAWGPADGLERTAFTSLATIIVTTGYGLMLLAAALIAAGRITARSGLLWGLAGFVTTGLAPSLGLSPELPGTAAAGLVERQVWWIGAALATAAGLWLILRTGGAIAVAAGVAIIALPHIIGAPHPTTLTTNVPSELSAHFASSSLVVHAITWALVGSIAGLLWEREDRRETA